MTTKLPYYSAVQYARDRGTADGTAAAGWVFDGNTPDATYRAILRGLENGDPAVWDQLPSADLSGQWADSLTGPSLVVESLLEAGYCGAYATAWQSADIDWLDLLCSAYEDQFSLAVYFTVERIARDHLSS